MQNDNLNEAKYSGISKLKVTGFKSLENVELEIAPLTVFLGENSIGKSSLVQALLLLVENMQQKNGAKLKLNGATVRLGTFAQVATIGKNLPMRIEVELPSVKPQDGNRKFSIGLTSGKSQGSSQAEIESIDIVTGPSEIKLKRKKNSESVFSISGRIFGRGELRSDVAFPYRSTVEIKPGRRTADFSSGLAEIPWEDFDEWKSARLDVRVPSKTSIAINLVVWSNFDALVRFARYKSSEPDKEETLKQAGAQFLPLKETLESIWLKFSAERDLSERFKAFVNELTTSYFSPPPSWLLKPTSLPKGVGFVSYEDWQASEATIESFLKKFEIPDTGIWFQAIETGEAFQDYQVELTELYYDLANGLTYLGPVRQLGTNSQRNDLFPSDILPLGLMGELTGFVLTEHYGREVNAPLPLPPGNELRCYDVVTAVEIWCEYFGIGSSLQIGNLGISGLEVKLDGKPLHSLGTGVSQLLPILVLCLVTAPGKLILLEQPELHLHPGAQQRLADFFLQIVASGRRVLVETHSEYLVTRLRRAVVVSGQDPKIIALQFVARDEKGQVQVTRSDMSKEGTFQYWPKGFFQQTDDDLLAILEASFGDEP